MLLVVAILAQPAPASAAGSPSGALVYSVCSGYTGFTYEVAPDGTGDHFIGNGGFSAVSSKGRVATRTSDLQHITTFPLPGVGSGPSRTLDVPTGHSLSSPSLAWSPEGDRLAYINNDEQINGMYPGRIAVVKDEIGAAPSYFQIENPGHEGRGVGGSLDWHGGKLLTFQDQGNGLFDSGNSSALVEIPVGATSASPLTANYRGINAKYSPTGGLMYRNGNGLTIDGQDYPAVKDGTHTIRDFSLSPDGQYVAIVFARTPTVDDDSLEVVALDGSNRKVLFSRATGTFCGLKWVATESPPTAAFTYKALEDPEQAYLVELDGSGSKAAGDRTIDKWEWDVNGDGATDVTGEKPKVVFNTPGTYEVTLTVTDDAGEKDKITKTIVASLISFYVRAPEGLTSPGHGFVQLRPGSGRQFGRTDLVWGRYPWGQPIDSPEVMRGDYTHAWDYRITFVIVDVEKYNAVVAYVNEHVDVSLDHLTEITSGQDFVTLAPYRYTLLSNNCVDFTKTAAGLAGVTIPQGSGPLNASTPLVLLAELENLYLNSGAVDHGGLVEKGDGKAANGQKPGDDGFVAPQRCEPLRLVQVALANPATAAGDLGLQSRNLSVADQSAGTGDAVSVDVANGNPVHDVTAVDFGDGSEPVGARASGGRGGTARTTRAAGSVSLTHTYTTPGTYDVHVINVSTGSVDSVRFKVTVSGPATGTRHIDVTLPAAPAPSLSVLRPRLLGMLDGALPVHIGGDELPVPVSPEPIATPPAPGPSITTRSAGLARAGFSFKRSPKRVTLDAKGRFTWTFAARPGLAGSAVFSSSAKIALSARAPARKKKVVTLGSGRFTVSAKGVGTVRLTLSKAALAYVKKHRSLGVTATVSSAGTSENAKTAFVLQPPKRKKVPGRG